MATYGHQITDINFALDEMTLCGLTRGSSEQPIILCLHGWLDNAASFVPLFEHFDNHHMIAIDWPGHGHSSHRSMNAHYHFIDYVYDLVLLFEHQHWSAVDIVAHSMGGMVASAFAAAFPEKVKSLTLIDSIGFISAPSAQTTEQLRSGMLSRLKLKDKRKPIHPTLDSAIKARQQASDLTYKDAKLLVERGSENVSNGFTWRADSRLRNTSPYRLTLSQAQQFIKDIQTPVQLIYGDKGLDLVEEGLAHFAPLFAKFSAYKLSGGHHIHMEQAEKIAGLIQRFIKNTDNIA